MHIKGGGEKFGEKGLQISRPSSPLGTFSQYIHEFSRELAFTALARPLRLDRDLGIDLQAGARI